MCVARPDGLHGTGPGVGCCGNNSRTLHLTHLTTSPFKCNLAILHLVTLGTESTTNLTRPISLGRQSPNTHRKMLAAHREDQENRVGHLAGPSKQQLQAKTPGSRFPKTPLKVPLNDENANHGFGGKSVLRTKGNNENIVTVGKAGKLNVVTPAGTFSSPLHGFALFLRC